MKLPTLDKVCTKCLKYKDAEEFQFTATHRMRRIRDSRQCNRCKSKVWYDPISPLRSRYLCALWKLIRLGRLHPADLSDEHSLRWDRARHEAFTTYTRHFTPLDITRPTEDEMEEYTYALLIKQADRDVEDTIHAMWLKC